MSYRLTASYNGKRDAKRNDRMTSTVDSATGGWTHYVPTSRTRKVDGKPVTRVSWTIGCYWRAEDARIALLKDSTIKVEMETL